MRVLLVDDDPAVRTIIRRILARHFELDVTECANGMDALEALAAERYGLILLDVAMPVLDGLEVLQAMRQTPALKHVPVLMMSGIADYNVVQHALGLGVSDFVVKPIRPAQLFERVSGMVGTGSSKDAGPELSRPGFQPLVLDASTPVMIVDGSTEFRQFFRKCLKDLCPVLEASTSLAALRVCLEEQSPAALFVGSDLGVLSGDVFGRKLRHSRRADGVRLIGIQPPQLLVKARKNSSYEAVIMRSFVTEVFMEGFNSLLHRPGRLAGLLATIPDLKLLGIAAAEEALGAALQRPVVLRPATAQPKVSRSSTASVVLHAGADALPLGIQLGVPDRTIKRLAGGLKNVPDELGTDADSILPWLLGQVVESLESALLQRGVAVKWDPPTPDRRIVRGPEPHGAGPDERMALSFDVPGLSVSFDLHLTAADSAVMPSSLIGRRAVVREPAETNATAPG